MAELEIIGTLTCPYVQRTRIVLLEKGLESAFKEVDLRNKPDWFLAVSPYGKVPVLNHGDVRLYESAVINEYLEEVFPSPGLMPKTPGLRGHARIWIDFCNNYLVPANGKLLRSEPGDERDAARAKLAERFRQMEFEGLEKLSGPGPYWFGETVSLVDITFHPHFERMVATETYRNAKIPEDCERLLAWREAMRARPSVKETSRPAEHYLERYARYADKAEADATAA
ncbi:MAG: glutathione S-transferase family protein [Alphaproteobacteria bacterium]